MPDTGNLRRRANLLLLLAQKARDDNYIKLAESIADRAAQLFDEADAAGEVQVVAVKTASRRPSETGPIAPGSRARRSGY